MLMQARQLKDDYIRNGFKKKDEERVYAAYDKAYSEIRKYLAKEKARQRRIAVRLSSLHIRCYLCMDIRRTGKDYYDTDMVELRKLGSL